MTIKAVSFDFWFTIASTNKDHDKKIDDVRRKGIKNLFTHYGIPINAEEIIPKLQQGKKNIIQMKKERGFVDFSSRHIQIPYILDNLIPEMPLYLSRGKPILKERLLDELSEIVTTALLSNIPPLIPHVDTVIQFVKNQNLKTGIISNTGLTKGESLRKVLEQFDILQHFDTILFSDEVKLMKPNPKIFKLLVENLNLKPYEIIHIGDTIYADIVGAREAGLHEGILFLGAFDDEYQYRTLEEDYIKYKPKYVIDDYKDFPQVLKAIFNGESKFIKINNETIKQRLRI
jgi:HAD superfamily hydrolase (TIGR01509 family)